LWEERKLVEWNAFIWPIEDLPLLRARMRRRKHGRNLHYEWERRTAAFLKENTGFRRYVLRELGKRGPLLARELEDRSARQRESHVWWGSRDVGIMLEILYVRGEVAIVGRRGKQRVWDLAERWYPPEKERITFAEAQRAFEEKRWRATGVRLVKGERIHAYKNVTVNEEFFQGHFPGHPIMPGVLIVEAMAQVGGMLLMGGITDPGNKVVYFTSLNNVKWRRPVKPGDQLRFELDLLQVRGPMCKMQGVAKVDGEIVCEAEMSAMVRDR